MTSLSQLVEISDSVPILSIGHVRFEFYFLLPMAVGVALLGVEILVGTWSMGATPDPAGGAVLRASSVGMVGENSGSSWLNTT